MQRQVNEQIEASADLYGKYEYHKYCKCGNELKTEQEQDRCMCNDCI